MRMIKCLVVLLSMSLLACGQSDASSEPDESPDKVSEAAAKPASAVAEPDATKSEDQSQQSDKQQYATSDSVEGLWKLTEDASTLSFQGTQNGNSFTGTFDDFDAMIVFDPDALQYSFITVTVDMASAKTGDKQRDTSLPAKEWFHTEEFPKAVFKSKDIRSTGDNVYEAVGTLTIRDVVKNVTLPFTLAIEEDTAKASGSLDVIRTDFGVGQGSEWETGQWVALEVGISFDITATRS